MSPFKDLRKTLFAFPCFLEGYVRVHVCVRAFAGMCCVCVCVSVLCMYMAHCQVEPCFPGREQRKRWRA